MVNQKEWHRGNIRLGDRISRFKFELIRFNSSLAIKSLGWLCLPQKDIDDRNSNSFSSSNNISRIGFQYQEQ